MNLKQNVKRGLRKTGMLAIADQLRYHWQKLRYSAANRRFKKDNPTLILPPPFYIYETYKLNYAQYYNDGNETAKELVVLIKKHISFEADDKILDWGCGPARITRHLPALLPGMKIYATDYNDDYIEWNKQNIHEVCFKLNSSEPPLNYKNDFFTAIIGLSIFTHLSFKAHEEWIKELNRILKKGGVLIVTAQGDAYRNKLLLHEQAQFDKGFIVVRDNYKLGHRLYSAFQPEEAIIRMVEDDFSIAEHIKGTNEGQQDMWVLIKK